MRIPVSNPNSARVSPTRALVITREIGDRRGEGTALWTRRFALDRLGDRAKPFSTAQGSLTIKDEIEDL